MNRAKLWFTFALLLLIVPAFLISGDQARAQNAAAIVIYAQDEQGMPLPGGCFTLAGVDVRGYSSGLSYVCDGDDGTEDGVTGMQQFTYDQPARVVMGKPPKGYRLPRASPLR